MEAEILDYIFIFLVCIAIILIFIITFIFLKIYEQDYSSETKAFKSDKYICDLCDKFPQEK